MRAARSSSWAQLSRFERPVPVMTDYDGLLGQEVAP